MKIMYKLGSMEDLTDGKGRLPDVKFFDFPEDWGASLVRVDYHAMGGARDYYIVTNPSQLAELIAKTPARSRVWIAEVETKAWADCVYTADGEGNLKPGSY